MQLLETFAQDIKSSRNYKPCAPEFFRWLVIGSYMVVIFSAVIWGVFVFREHQQDTLATQDKKDLTEIGAQISAIQAQGAQSNEIRARYEDWNNWLKGNYNLSSFLMEIYKSLPQGTRLQELTLKPQPNAFGNFSIMMRFFSRGANSIPSTEDFEDKLTVLGVSQQDRQQTVGEAGRTEINANLVLPAQFYPGNSPLVANSTQTKTGDNLAPNGKVKKP